MLNRREMIRTTGLAGAGAILGIGATAPQCGSSRNLSTYVQMIAGGFTEIKVQLPALGLSQDIINRAGGLLDKGVRIAKDFDEAYKAGKFTDASSLFTNLGSMITQVVGTLGVSTENRVVKIALAAIGVARVGIAILLSQQTPRTADVIKRSARPGTPEARAVTEIERLASTDLTKVLAALPQ